MIAKNNENNSKNRQSGGYFRNQSRKLESEVEVTVGHLWSRINVGFKVRIDVNYRKCQIREGTKSGIGSGEGVEILI